MRRVFLRRPSGAMVVAIIALVVAVSGTAVAATKMVNGDKVIIKGTLSGNRLREQTLTGAQIKPHSLTAAQIRAHTLTATQINLNKLGKVNSAKLADRDGRDHGDGSAEREQRDQRGRATAASPRAPS